MTEPDRNAAKCRSDEQHRHECEVRFVRDMRSNADRGRYLERVEKARGSDAAQRLRSDAWDLMRGTA